ncbi:MAG TPA: YbhB/YbcL family Raf kinase inhibitor-like protein, partial [Polyangiaceae bacterium]
MEAWQTMLFGLTLTACNGCGSASHPSSVPGTTLASISVTSRAFANGGAIPVDYSCDGTGKSPPLTWSAPPEGTKTMAIILDDPDAPGGTFTHWIAFNIPAATVSLPEGADIAALGGAEGDNGFDRPGYGGPCPPRREMHRYYFHVYALDKQLTARPGASRDEVDAAMQHAVL